MTEAEWLTSVDINAMCWRVRPGPAVPPRSSETLTRRVAALFSVGCIRATPQVVDQPFLRTAAEVVERAADAGDWSEVDRLLTEASRQCAVAYRIGGENSVPHFWALAGLRLTEGNIGAHPVHVPFFLMQALADSDTLPQLRQTYSNILRDIVRNPSRDGRGRQLAPGAKPPKRGPFFRSEWRSSDVMLLARGIYDYRAFDRMPILADALQDAGCDSSAILDHCRDTSVSHVRGCWVVDLVLGKS